MHFHRGRLTCQLGAWSELSEHSLRLERVVQTLYFHISTDKLALMACMYVCLILAPVATPC